MNEISFRQGPEFGFFLKEHQPEFERRTLEVYSKSVEGEKHRYLLPHIYDDMFLHILLSKREQFAAAYLGRKHRDDQWFFKQTEGMDERQRYQFTKEITDKYNSHIEPEYDDLVYEDIKAVLNFHNVSYIDISEYHKWEGLKSGFYYRNLPINQVW